MKHIIISRSVSLNNLIELFLLVAVCAVLFPATAQISVSGWTKPATSKTEDKPLPSLEAQAAQGDAPQIHRNAAMKISALKKYKMASPATAEMRPKLNEKKMKIGVVRKLPQILNVLEEGSQLNVEDGVIRAIRIESEGAVQTRLHFSRLDLPENVQMFVYAANNSKEFYGPFRKGTAEFWTPPITGSEAVIEIFTPIKAEKKTEEKLNVAVDQVIHIFRHARTANKQTSVEKEIAQTEAASSCNREVPSEWSEAAKSVALIQFSQSDGEYVCSGVLLNDSNNSGTPYLLTANHCIDNSEAARGAKFYWNFDTTGTPSHYNSNFGAQLLKTSDINDFTLMKLYTTVPSGVRFSGWTTEKPAIATPVVSVHHPDGDYKRISFGQTEAPNCPTDFPSDFCDYFHQVRWNSGITEPGSSGGGLWVGAAADPKLVGQLFGGESSCLTPTAADYYGRFDVAFESIGNYLTGKDCQFAISQEKQLIDRAGGQSSVGIFANEVGGCQWNARSNVDWIKITTKQGLGDGEISFSTDPNSSPARRVGVIFVAGNVLEVTQRGSGEICTPAGSISLGQTIQGNLESGTCFSQANPGGYTARYTFDAVPGQLFAVSLRSRKFDAYLTILGPNGEIILENDDESNTNQNSRIPNAGYNYQIGLPRAGTYTIEVTSYDPNFIGDFTLTLEKGCFITTKSKAQKFGADGSNFEIEVTTDPTCNLGQLQMGLLSNTDWWGSKFHPSYSYLSTYLNEHKGKFTFETGINMSARIRRGLIEIAGQQVLLEQAPFCSTTNQPTITPALASYDGHYQFGELQVKSAAFCTWTVSPQTYDWLFWMNQYDFGDRTSDQTLRYTLADNKSNVARTGTFQIGDKIHTVTQQPFNQLCPPTPITIGQTVTGTLAKGDCEPLRVNPDNIPVYTDRFSFRGYANQQIAVSFSSPEFMGVLGYRPGGGEFLFKFAYEETEKSFRLPTVGYFDLYEDGIYTIEIRASRPSEVAVGAYTFNIEAVGGANCVFLIDKQNTEIINPAGGDFLVNLNATSMCTWTAKSSTDWITFASGATGSGSKAINVHVAPNLGAPRRAYVSVGGRSFEVFQDASCNYVALYSGSDPPRNRRDTSSLGASFGLSFITGAGCPLTFKSGPPWLTLNSINGGTVEVTVAKNSGSLRRSEIDVSGVKVEIVQGAGNVAVVSAADYSTRIPAQGIVSIFSEELAMEVKLATELPLPLSLSDVGWVSINNSLGNLSRAQMFYVSPTQINLLLPPEIMKGEYFIEIGRWGGLTSNGRFSVALIAPALFSAESNGAGIAAANIQRVKANGEQQFDFVSAVDATGKIIGKPIDLGITGDKVYLLLYGIGTRFRSDVSNVICEIDGQNYPVEYAGPQGFFVGVDQINILLPNSLRGKGEVNVRLKVEDKVSNTVKIKIAP